MLHASAAVIRLTNMLVATGSCAFVGTEISVLAGLLCEYCFEHPMLFNVQLKQTF
jgi:hypothetical protein